MSSYYKTHSEEKLKELKQSIEDYRRIKHLKWLINNHKDIEEIRKRIID